MLAERYGGAMKKLILTLVILVVMTNIVYADAIWNGVDWKGLSNDPDQNRAMVFKLLFIRGIYDGVGFANEDAEFKKAFFISESDSYLNLIDALDKFYSNPRNINITIAEALFIVACGLRGEKQEVIEELTESGRRNASSRPLRQEWAMSANLEKQHNEVAAPIVAEHEDSSQFWRAFGQRLFDDYQHKAIGRARETESIQSGVQVIGTRPSYRINNGYVYPVDSDKSAYRVSGSYLYPSDEDIRILGNEKK